MSSHSTNIIPAPKGKSIIVLGVFFGVISTILSISFVLGIMSMSPYIFAYYKHGGKVYISSVVCGMLFLLLFQIFMTTSDNTIFSLGVDNSEISNDVSTYIEEDKGIQLQDNSIADYAPSIYKILFQYITGVMGIGLFLVCSKLRWMSRLIIAVFFISLGVIPLIPLMQATAYDILAASTAIDPRLLGDTFIVLLPVMATVMFLSNMIFSTMALSIRAKIPYHIYNEYVLKRIFSEKITLSPLVLIVLGGIAWLLGYFKQGLFHNMQLFFISTMVVVLLCFCILGVAGVYNYIVRSMNMRATWYFFSCCTIMLVPLINIFAILVFSIIGMRCNYSNYRYRVRNKKEGEER